MTLRRFTRRDFLRGAGGAAVAVPILGSGLFGTPAFGRTPTSGPALPKRFIFMLHPNGVITEQWFPQQVRSESDFDLNVCHAPLQRYKDRLTLFHGVHLSSGSVGPGEPHQKGMGAMLSGMPLQEGDFVGGDGSRAGWGSGVTIDQLLARQIGRQTPFGSLELGVRADSHGGSEVRTRISYAGPGQPLPPQNDPGQVFDRLFSDFMTDEGVVQEVRQRRASILDGVLDQFDALMRRAGAEDRARLEQHMELVRDMERRLAVGDITGAACMVPATPEAMAADSEDTMPKIMKAQIDLMVMAMACDLTRVATLQISNAKNHIRYPWLDSLGDGHGLSHAGPSNTQAINEWVARDTWHAAQLAYLCDALANIPEGEGTMLDHTLILWCSEIARGNTHSHKDMPFLMVGSNGGYFKTGRYLRYSDASHNDLLVSIMHSFGVEVKTVGDERFCSGPLSGLTA